MKASITSYDGRRREPARSPDKVVNLMQACVVDLIRRDMPIAIAIHGETRIAADLGFDSLAMMELVFALEDRFAISIPLEAVACINTVDDLVDTLLFHLKHCRAA